MKRRIKLMACCLVITILAGVLSIYNASDVMAAEKAKVELDGVGAMPGGEFDMPVTFYSAKGVGGYQLMVSYDSKLFEFVSGETVTESAAFDVNPEDGKITVTAVLKQDIAAVNEVVFKLRFKVKSTTAADTYPFSFSGGELTDGTTYADVPYEAIDGLVIVSSVLKGDVDGNGKINITDAMRVFQYVSGRNKAFTDRNFAAADINGDGKVNITDAIKIFHFVSGRIKTFDTSASSTIGVTGVTLSNTSLNLTTGQTATLTATVSPSNATDKSVTWSSSNANVATVDGNGKVTAKGAGSATITVKTASGGKTAVCTVVVVNPTVEPTGIALSNTSLNLTTGQTATLTATVSPSNATNKTVTWSSNNTNIVTVDGNGKVTAKGAGSATITAKTASGGKTAVCTVNVRIPVTGVSIVQSSEKIYLDAYSSEKKQLTCNIQPSNATNKSVTWTSSNTGIATVDANGNVTAVNPGVVTITAKTNDGGYTAKKEIYVYRRKATPPSGTYLIKSKANQGLCFDVENGNISMNSGQEVKLHEIHKGSNQQWRFDNYTSQYGGYAIVVPSKSLVLDVYRPTNGNMNIDYGDKLDIYDFNDKEAQMWYFVKLWDGSYRIVLNSSDGGGIITSSGNVNGASLMLHGWDWNNPYQEWIFEQVDMPSSGNSNSGIEKAISWANSQLGSQAYNYWCLKFIGDAFRQGGIQNAGYMTATQAGNKLITNTDKNPPRGAVVFWNWYGTIDGVYDNYGHVGISLGNGQVIHADYDGVKITGIDLGGSRTYRGWGTWK